MQLALNVLFLLPIFRQTLWKMLLKGDSVWSDAVLLFTGYAMANALIFRGVDTQNASSLTLSAFRTANRALYVDPKQKSKRLWIVNTHLTAAAQSRYDVEQQQIEQIESILEWMEEAISSQPADGMVICSDFNAIPGSKAYALMMDKGFCSISWP